VLFWAIVITGAVLLIRSLSGQRRLPPSDEATPAEILARRFARGEISEQEFIAKTRLVKH
jgi:putative membrane protein